MIVRRWPVLLSILLLLISCGKKERIVEVPVPMDCAPSAPRGVYSVNMGDRVEIVWYPNPETDVVSYDVYRGAFLYGDYFYIGSVNDVDPDPADYYYDDTDVETGVQYFYAVVAVDAKGNESDLSYEEVSGTPRPEGQLTIYAATVLPDHSGYDFSSLSDSSQAYNLATTDIYFSTSSGFAQLVAYRAGVDIQDYGFTGDFDAVNYAPTEGWSISRSAEAIAGHCYILRLFEGDGDHYAKLFVNEVTDQSVKFTWGYQTAPNNRDLSPGKAVEPSKVTDERVPVVNGG